MSGSVDLGAAGQSLLRASLSRTGKWAGGLGVVGGFVADILSPLAPFAAYIALAGAVTAALELSAPGWEHHFESITLYQQGWRLGGKGACGRGRDLRRCGGSLVAD